MMWLPLVAFLVPGCGSSRAEAKHKKPVLTPTVKKATPIESASTIKIELLGVTDSPDSLPYGLASFACWAPDGSPYVGAPIQTIYNGNQPGKMVFLRFSSNEPTTTHFIMFVPGDVSANLSHRSVSLSPGLYSAHSDGKHSSIVQVSLQITNLKANSLRLGIIRNDFKPVVTLKAPLDIDLDKLSRRRLSNRRAALTTPPAGVRTAGKTKPLVSLHWPIPPTATIASGDWGSLQVTCTDWMLASGNLPEDLPHGMDINYRNKEMAPSKIARTTAITKKGHRYVWVGNKFMYDYRVRLPNLTFEDLDRIEIEAAEIDYKDIGPISFVPKKASPNLEAYDVKAHSSVPGLCSIEAHSLVVHDSYEEWYGLVYKPNGEIWRGYPGVVESAPPLGDNYPQSIGTVYLNFSDKKIKEFADVRLNLYTMPSLTSIGIEPAITFIGQSDKRKGCLFIRYSPKPKDRYVKVSVEAPEGDWKSVGTVYEPIRRFKQLSRKVSRDQFYNSCGFRIGTGKGLEEFFWNGGKQPAFMQTGLRLPAKDLQLRLLAHPKKGAPFEVARMILAKGLSFEVRFGIEANGRPFFSTSHGSFTLDNTESIELQMKPLREPRFLTATIPPLPVKSKTISMTVK